MLSDWWFFPRLARHLEGEVLPAAAEALARWRRRAAAIPDGALRARALSSLGHKRFHAEGAAVLAAFAPRRRALVEAFVAVQTISDYLDSLVDRPLEGSDTPPTASRRLHRAMVDAVTPGRTPAGDYYRHVLPAEGMEGDGGYLEALVARARGAVEALPGAREVAGPVERLARQYGEMQVLKHGPPPSREHALAAWHGWWGHGRRDGWTWWESAASAGSTLGIFACLRLAAALRINPAAVSAVRTAYVPWVTGLHILLDYLVDRREDAQAGDLNFTRPYGPPETASARLAVIYREALRRVSALPDAGVHRAVVVGLPALYGTDAKVSSGADPDLERAVCRLWRAAGLIGLATRARVARQRRRGAWASVGPNGPR